MSLELARRIKAIEAEVTALRGRVGALENTAPAIKPEASQKKLCPKCGKVPAYFFHVKNCREQKQDDGRRATDTT